MEHQIEVQPQGPNQYRIFVTYSGTTDSASFTTRFSIDINCHYTPSQPEIINLFNQHRKQFWIEV